MIRGFFDPRSSWPMPRVTIGLFIPGIMTAPASIDFLIDTGASATCLHPRDAISAVGIDPQRLADPRLWLVQEPYVGVGGIAVSYIVPVRYIFRHEDGSEQMLDGDLRIAQLTAQNRSLPSLLGWDVLRQFELVTNWRDRRVTLDSL